MEHSGKRQKASQLVLVWTIAGIALVAAACGEGDQGGLTLLGEGGCRVADGGEGEPASRTAASWEECAARCSNGGGACTALEYNSNTGLCEVHSEPITTFEPVAGVMCYVVE